MPKFSDLPIIDDHSQKVLENILADILNEMTKESLNKLKHKFQEEREHFDDGVHPIVEIAFKAVANFGSTRHILRDVVGIMNWQKINRFAYIENRYELEKTLFPSFDDEEQGELLDKQLEQIPCWIMFNDNVAQNFIFHIKNKDRQMNIIVDWKDYTIINIYDENDESWDSEDITDSIDAAIRYLTFS